MWIRFGSVKSLIGSTHGRKGVSGLGRILEACGRLSRFSLVVSFSVFLVSRFNLLRTPALCAPYPWGQLIADLDVEVL